MEPIRKRLQGVINILRFNWHLYVLAIVVLLIGIFFLRQFMVIKPYWLLLFFLPGIAVFISLVVSWYVYDVSGLYGLHWLDALPTHIKTTIVNINAGFDETSSLLKQRFKMSTLVVLDFYDPLKHTEVSVKRARKAYPPFPGTVQVKTNELPLVSESVDAILVMFSAHEIRDANERIVFFRELKRILKPEGQIFVTEHLRDTANFLAYTVGFLHFYSKVSWDRTFRSANLALTKEIKSTPFVSTFILEKNGNSL